MNTEERRYLAGFRAFCRVGLLCLALTGCGTLVETRVNVAHMIPSKSVDNGFVIFPADVTQTNSADFKTCTDRIALRLEEASNRRMPVSALASADWVVVVGWSLDGAESISYTPRPIRQEDGTMGGWSYVSEPKTGYVPSKGAIRVTPKNRILLVDIFDAKALEQGRWVKVFEGRLTSPGRDAQISETLRTLVDALFLDFPNPSGSVRNSNLLHWRGTE